MEPVEFDDGCPAPTAAENEPNVLPAFLYSAMLCEQIGDPVDLNFFEPRYREMCRRMGAFGGGDPRFLFVPHFRNNGSVKVGDVAYVVSIQQMANLGTFLVRGRCIRVVVVVAAWVEPGTRGLHMCKFIPVDAARGLHRLQTGDQPQAGGEQAGGEQAGGEQPELVLSESARKFKDVLDALTTEAHERCGDWTVHAEEAARVYNFRKGERDLKASVLHLKARSALCSMVHNLPHHTGLALLGTPGDVQLMKESLRELIVRRVGVELDESMLLLQQPDEKAAAYKTEEAPELEVKLHARPAEPRPRGDAFLVSMETVLRLLQNFDEADLEPNPCTDFESWTDGLQKHVHEYVAAMKPRELKRMLATFLKVDVAGLLEVSEIRNAFTQLIMRKWRRRHVGACVFNRFLKGAFDCEQICGMGLCGEAFATATMHVYPMVGVRSATSDSLEARNYFERMGPRIEETTQNTVHLPDQVNSQNEGCVHIMNVPSGNINISVRPQDVLLNAGAAQSSIALLSKRFLWDKAGRLLWAGHRKHTEDECQLARLHPELLRKVCSYMTIPNDERCWRL